MSRGGRQYGRAHLPVESCHSLSSWGTFQFAQMWAGDDAGDNFEWQFGTDFVELKFTRDNCEWVQQIALTFTSCRYGGKRAWFVCPRCAGRVGKVYLPCTMYAGNRERVTRFLCRACYDLTYEQRRERAPYWTMIHRAERIEERWLGEVTTDFIYKRKGQHWRTFNKRVEQRERAIQKSNAACLVGLRGFAARLGIDL